MEPLKISLCIPTINRFDTFLGMYLEQYVQYLQEGLIHEIVISDENGNDYDKIRVKYAALIDNNQGPMRVYKNASTLGPLLNKLTVCHQAKYPVIALIDSDNFTPREYFQAARHYYQAHIRTPYFILSPSVLRESPWNFTKFTEEPLTRKNIRKYLDIEHAKPLLNDGNYIFSKKLIEEVQISLPSEIRMTWCCDVALLTLYFFQQFESFELHVVPGMEYYHVVHPESTYLQNCAIGDSFQTTFVYPSFYKLE